MKKIRPCIALIFIFLPFLAEAQFDRGRFLLGGSGSLSYNHINTGLNGSTSNLMTYNLETRAGLFFRRGLAGGIFFHGEYFRNYFASDTHISGYQTLVGPFIRYYFRNHIFIAADAAIGNGRETIRSVQLNQNVERRKDLFYGSLGLGYAIMVGQNVAFEPLFHVDGTNDINRNDANDVVRRTRIRISIGITVFLN